MAHFSHINKITDIYTFLHTLTLLFLLLLLFLSPRAQLLVVGMLRFMSNINQLSLPTPFYSVFMSVSVFMALSTVFHSITSPNNSPFLTLFFRSYLCLNSPNNSPFLTLFFRSYLYLIGPFNYISLSESLLQPRYNP